MSDYRIEYYQKWKDIKEENKKLKESLDLAISCMKAHVNSHTDLQLFFDGCKGLVDCLKELENKDE